MPDDAYMGRDQNQAKNPCVFDGEDARLNDLEQRQSPEPACSRLRHLGQRNLGKSFRSGEIHQTPFALPPPGLDEVALGEVSLARKRGTARGERTEAGV